MLTRYLLIGLAIALAAGLIFGPVAGGTLGAIVMGFMAGNFACSLVHRLPRGKSILENKPYCGECGHALSERDLLPVFGALLLKHRCRYCGVKFPVTHTFTEILIGALFALCYLRFNFSEDFLLVGGIGIFLIILSCIDINDRRVQTSVLVTTVVLGMLYRTLHDATIFHSLQGGLYGALLGAILWRREIKPINHIYTFPDGAKLMAMAGMVAGAADIWLVFVLFVAANALLHVGKWVTRRERVPLTVPLSLALMVPLLFPELSLNVLLPEVYRQF